MEKFELSQRVYTSGTQFRPKPLVNLNPENGTLVVATPWGSRDAAQRAMQVILEQLEAPVGEVTTIGSGYGEGRLGTALFLANQTLESMGEAVEVIVIVFEGDLITWAQVGQPQLILKRANEIFPLATDLDLAAQVNSQLPPLFSHALGLEKVAPVKFGSAKWSKDTALFLVASSATPSSLYALPDKFNFDYAAEQLIKSQPQHPFWLGQLFRT